MGRKIPAKKHHGVKDPAKQAEQRLAKIKCKINEVPLNIDDQEVPRKLKILFRSKDRQKKGQIQDGVKPLVKTLAKNLVKPSVKEQKNKVTRTPQRAVKKVPTFTRIPGESDRNLLWRAELTTRQYLNKSKFEDKYDVDMEKDEKTGEVKVKKRDWSYLDDGKKDEPANKWEKKKLKKIAKKELEKSEKIKLKKEKLKEKKLYKKNKNNDDFIGIKQDKVEFGEVAEAPPQLTAKPRKSSHLERPGYRDLLLKSQLKTSEKGAPTAVNLSGKRKDLPALERQRLEDERQRVVELYRAQVALKQKNPA